jgi:hypothetical protein
MSVGFSSGKLPGFFRHAGEPNAILEEHSPETAYATITLAIRLWEEHGQKLNRGDAKIWRAT